MGHRFHRQHNSPEAGSPASLPLLVIGHSCICRRKGGLNAETEELVHGDPRPGTARSALCNPVVARQRFRGKDEAEERSAPSQASAWSWSAAGIEEQEGVRSDGEGRRTLDRAYRGPGEAAPSPRVYCVTHDIILMRVRHLCARVEGGDPGRARAHQRAAARAGALPARGAARPQPARAEGVTTSRVSTVLHHTNGVCGHIIWSHPRGFCASGRRQVLEILESG